MVKVYQLKRLAAGKFTTNYMNTTVDLEFVSGRGTFGADHAELVTNNPFVQDAIEHDARFGSVFTLAATYGDLKDATPIEVTKAQVINTNGRRYIKPAQQKPVEAKEEKTEEAPKAAKKAKKAEAPKAEQVESVSTLNDAYDYFAEKGIVVENEEQLKDAMKNANVEFPNLK